MLNISARFRHLKDMRWLYHIERSTSTDVSDLILIIGGAPFILHVKQNAEHLRNIWKKFLPFYT